MKVLKAKSVLKKVTVLGRKYEIYSSNTLYKNSGNSYSKVLLPVTYRNQPLAVITQICYRYFSIFMFTDIWKNVLCASSNRQVYTFEG